MSCRLSRTVGTVVPGLSTKGRARTELTQVKVCLGKVIRRQTDLSFNLARERQELGRMLACLLSIFCLPPKAFKWFTCIMPLMEFRWKSGPQGGE